MDIAGATPVPSTGMGILSDGSEEASANIIPREPPTRPLDLPRLSDRQIDLHPNSSGASLEQDGCPISNFSLSLKAFRKKRETINFEIEQESYKLAKKSSPFKLRVFDLDGNDASKDPDVLPLLAALNTMPECQPSKPTTQERRMLSVLYIQKAIFQIYEQDADESIARTFYQAVNSPCILSDFATPSDFWSTQDLPENLRTYAKKENGEFYQFALLYLTLLISRIPDNDKFYINLHHEFQKINTLMNHIILLKDLYYKNTAGYLLMVTLDRLVQTMKRYWPDINSKQYSHTMKSFKQCESITCNIVIKALDHNFHTLLTIQTGLCISDCLMANIKNNHNRAQSSYNLLQAIYINSKEQPANALVTERMLCLILKGYEFTDSVNLIEKILTTRAIPSIIYISCQLGIVNSHTIFNQLVKDIDAEKALSNLKGIHNRTDTFDGEFTNLKEQLKGPLTVYSKPTDIPLDKKIVANSMLLFSWLMGDHQFSRTLIEKCNLHLFSHHARTIKTLLQRDTSSVRMSDINGCKTPGILWLHTLLQWEQINQSEDPETIKTQLSVLINDTVTWVKPHKKKIPLIDKTLAKMYRQLEDMDNASACYYNLYQHYSAQSDLAKAEIFHRYHLECGAHHKDNKDRLPPYKPLKDTDKARSKTDSTHKSDHKSGKYKYKKSKKPSYKSGIRSIPGATSQKGQKPSPSLQDALPSSKVLSVAPVNLAITPDRIQHTENPGDIDLPVQNPAVQEALSPAIFFKFLKQIEPDLLKIDYLIDDGRYDQAQQTIQHLKCKEPVKTNILIHLLLKQRSAWCHHEKACDTYYLLHHSTGPLPEVKFNIRSGVIESMLATIINALKECEITMTKQTLQQDLEQLTANATLQLYLASSGCFRSQLASLCSVIGHIYTEFWHEYHRQDYKALKQRWFNAADRINPDRKALYQAR